MNALAAVLETEAPNLRAEFTERIKAAWHKSREKIISLGRALIEAKQQLEHGEFTAMIEADLPFGPDNARRFMRIASDPRLANHATAHVLPEAAGAMDELQKLDDVQFEAAIAQGRITPTLTVRDARELVQEMNQQREREAYQSHRVQAASISTPRFPENGVARCYDELVGLLVAARQRAQMTHLELDNEIQEMLRDEGKGRKWQDGYVGKLERPDSLYGRSAVHPTFDLWLKGLGLGLKIVSLNEAA